MSRSVHIARAGCFALLSTAVLAHGSIALGAETLWTAPAGGLWSDPANWSNGVPTGSVTAVLPLLDSDGYAITVGGTASCAALRVESPGVSIVGGIIQCGGPLSVGAGQSVGDLSLVSAALSAQSVSVGGASGDGSISVAIGSGLVTTGPLKVADPNDGGGVGLLDIDSGAYVSAGQVTLGPGATLDLEAKYLANPILIAQGIAADGTLTITPHPELTFPDIWVQLTFAPVSGAFDVVNPPVVSGTPMPVNVSVSGISLPLQNPWVGLEITVAEGTTVVGFEHWITVTAVRLSGQTQIVTLQSTFDLPVGDENVVLIGTSLIPLNTSPFTLQATATLDGEVVTGELSITALADPVITYPRVDVASDGTPGDGVLPTDLLGEIVYNIPDMTPDGRYAAFVSTSWNPSSQAPLGVWVKDLWTGELERVDDELPIASVGSIVLGASISDDGRFVAFTRQLTSVPMTTMVWLHDRWMDTTTPLCLKPDGTIAAGQPGYAKVSGDGSTVVYRSTCEGLIEGVPASPAQIIAYDIATGVSTLVSATAAGEPANAPSALPVISCDGRLVAFHTNASNLVGGNLSNTKIVLRDRVAGTNERVDVGPLGAGNASAVDASISCDGRFVSFGSNASNLAAADTDVASDIFVRDRLLGTTAHASPNLPDGASLNGFRRPMVSDDGAFVTYIGTASLGSQSLHPARVLRAHLPTLAIDDVALTAWGSPIGVPPLGLWQANWGRNWISGDGQRILFVGDSSALAPTQPLGVPYGGNNNGLFIRNFAPPQPADLNNDGFVNAADLALLLGVWGSSGGPADLDGDGTVGAGDLALLVGAWS